MFPPRELNQVNESTAAKQVFILVTTGCQVLANNGKRIHTTKVIIAMNTTHDNILSRIEREYISFLYDNARRTTNQTVTISQIEDFIQTPEGQRGLESFKVMRKPSKPQTQPMRVGAFL